MTELSTRHAQRYDRYDLAHLAGGLPRVVDTAAVALVVAGRLRAEDGGLEVRAAGARHPVEAAVLELVGLRESRSLGTLRLLLAADARAADARLVAVGERLSRDGLIRSTPPFWAPSRPVTRTRAGQRMLRGMTAEPVAEGLGADPDAWAVALRGEAGLADRVLRRAVFGAPAPARSRGGWSSGAGSSGSVWGWDSGSGGGWGWGGGDGGGGDGGGGGGGDGGGC